MNKSVYSLVLMDNVVSEVDKMAYEMGTSRSNLINQILAEYVRYTTPEMRMRAVFEEMERLMQGVDSFQIQPQPSDAMLTIRSALRYTNTSRPSATAWSSTAAAAGAPWAR